MAKESVNGVKIVCSECGSDDIMEKSWFNPNTGESFGWDESEECYCKRCGKLTQWKEVRPTIEKKRTAYLVAISPIVRVVVEEKETIEETHEKAIQMAINKILANPEEYIHDENVEDIFEDLECPALD